jgi:hypothetical protein
MIMNHEFKDREIIKDHKGAVLSKYSSLTFFKNSSIRVVNFGTSKIPVKGYYIPAFQPV